MLWVESMSERAKFWSQRKKPSLKHLLIHKLEIKKLEL